MLCFEFLFFFLVADNLVGGYYQTFFTVKVKGCAVAPVVVCVEQTER